MKRDSVWILVVASVLTGVNAVKPAVVDDTAYLLFAKHLAQDPTDPYGFEIFWYAQPDPAMTVLLPPVLPYWLAFGMKFLGESVPLLKLWLFPIAWLFCAAVFNLLRRFAPGQERHGLVLICLSPAILSMQNLMLDVPALAIALAALAVYFRAAERSSVGLALLTGLLLALAIQTKYSTLLAPVLVLWAGWCTRTFKLAVLSCVVALVGFASWELWLLSKYGQSHFLFHLRDQQSSTTLAESLENRWNLIGPLAGHLGVMGVGLGLYAGRAAGFSSGIVRGTAVLWLAGFVLVVLLPFHKTILIAGNLGEAPKLDFAMLFANSFGTAMLVTITVALIRLLRSNPKPRSNWDRFLLGWFVLELAGYFLLTPFAAARRVLGVATVAGLIAVRAASQGRPPERWVLPFCVLLGGLVAALDTYDAYPEKWAAKQSEELTRSQGGIVWFQGHWGFQWYCEQAGMKLVVPNRSVLRPGNWLVLPLIPDEAGFYRPYHGEAEFTLDESCLEKVAEFTWDDGLAGQTVPNLYGGNLSVKGRDHPRIRVAVFRVIREWVPASK